MGGLASKLDPIADKAEALALKAEALKPDDSEIWALKKMITTLRFMAEPMQRYPMMQEAANQLEKARELNPQNPRVDLLEGQDKFYTPEQFGGSKAEARKLFEQALKKFEAFKTSDPLDPRWGRTTSVEMLKRISQQ